MNEEEVHLRKLAALGRLSGSVAHDFNNLLTVILGATGSLLQTPPQGDPTEALREIHDSALRARQLTRQLLSVSSRATPHPRLLDASTQIRELIRLMDRLLGDRMELDCALASDLPLISMDPGKLDQVILNLAVNARDAMDGRGTLAIRTYVATHPTGDTADDREGIWIEVADTGQGMDMETRKRVFEPFFTTKARSGGTGLGLATVFGIVSEAGGHIHVESEPGAGTTFHIWLPARESEAQDSSPPSGLSTLLQTAGGNEPSAAQDCPGRNVLLVEDDPSVRRLVARVLRNGGQRVLEAGSVREALEKLEEEGEIDLIITDLILPDASGLELANILDRERAHEEMVPIILMSGYSQEEAGPLGDQEHRVTFLPKPFRVEELEGAVHRSLEAPSN